MPQMSEAEINSFLAVPRYGMLSMLRADGSPITVPVWFEWNGASVQIFSFVESPKVGRLKSDPRATILVSNHLDEPPAWVAFDGNVEIHNTSGIELAERLAPHYWDMSKPEYQEELKKWRAIAEQIILLSMKPSRIRAHVE